MKHLISSPSLKSITYCLLLTLASCSLSTTKDLTEVSPKATTFKNNYFSNPQKDYVYKAKIEAFKKKMGGILIIKKMKEEYHRIVFTTEFGAKIFDFELEQGNFKVNTILDALDKKILINTLKKDFQSLLKEDLVVDKAYANANYMVYQSHFNKRPHFYFFSKEKDILEKMIQTTKTKEKVVISFEGKEADFAKKIRITHQNIPLTIDLKGF